MIIEVSDNNQQLRKFLHDNNINQLDNNPFSNSIIYVLDSEIVGFLNYSIMYEKAEINNIIVKTEFRGKHIASQMMTYLLDKCKNCDNITLEVRKNNEIAIKLYEKYGFKKVAIREKYYDGIDGILMIKEGE